MPEKIHGKNYFTVAERLLAFREDNPTASIITELLYSDNERVVMSAKIIGLAENGQKTCTGHAEEYRDSSVINKTSALENCETSAIGRALAVYDARYMGAAIASADEVIRAIDQQNQPTHRFKPGEKDEFTKQVRDAIYNGDSEHLKEVWHEQPKEAILKVWSEFNSTERRAIKDLLGDSDAST